MGRIIKIPDAEYRAWVNLNQNALDEMIKKKKIDPYWLAKGKNREYFERYLNSIGYMLT